MKLSVVVVVYDMAREAPRTLYSLSSAYQQGIVNADYEIIVVDNGSTRRLDLTQFARFGSNFQYHYLDHASPSPAAALNFGLRRAQGEVVGVMIDGARICTPGLLHYALAGTQMYNRAIVASVGFYLGKGFQRFAIMQGYDQDEEDRLLERIGWPQDGYRLFEVGSLDESSHWADPIAESNALFMRKELWVELGGVDERFDMPGGGVVNLDTFVRCCELPDSELVILLGEGTFHQVHGGIATNTPPNLHEQNCKRWFAQYREIRGKEFVCPTRPRKYVGHLPAHCLTHLTNDFLLSTSRQGIDELEALAQSAQADRDRLQAEVNTLSATIAAQNTAIAEREQFIGTLLGSVSWRITRPLRFVKRIIRNRGLERQDRQRAREVLGGIYQRLPLPLSIKRRLRSVLFSIVDRLSEQRAFPDVPVLLHPQRGEEADIFIWAIIDWHFRIQRPQHLARELARSGKRVFYMSVQFIDDPHPGFSVEPIDDSGRLFQVHLHVNGAPPIYSGIPTLEARTQLQKGAGEVLNWTKSRKIVSLIEHPFWFEAARILPNARLVYDCMDHHEGFGGFSPELSSQEQALMRTAELVVVTSRRLDDVASKYNDQRAIIRNACEYEHFANPPLDCYRDPYGDRQIIGYYGAIASWFDVELVAALADRFPDCCVLLVGDDTCGARQRLQSHPNVLFVGEVEYDKLPYYLYGFAVCILPFHIVPLTLATNPVKVYEYLSAGKTVVATDLPELRQLGDLVHIAPDRGAFSDAVAAALAELPDDQLVARRKAFAREQTWVHRAQELAARIRDLPEPLVSIIVITYNNLDLTETCLQSLEAHSDYGTMEVIVVDNASADGTADYLTAWSARDSDRRRVILNQDNRGFAAANNQGLAVARGDYLVMLNNDTHVTPGWLRTLVNHLRRDGSIGLIGPVTNNIGNEARIEMEYPDMALMMEMAAHYTRRHLGQLFELRTAAFFCAMMPARVYQTVGPLDEAFGIGFFEDDDYCRRIEQAGYRIVCAEDVFVHHHLSASFNQLGAQQRAELFEKSRKIYEQKWGPWVPHSYRTP